MSIIYVLIPIAILLTALGVYLFFWAVKTDQFEDLEKQGLSILFDDEQKKISSDKNIPKSTKEKNMIKPGRYQHFKGNYYQVLHVATHSETDEKHVVYQPEYGDKGIWIRPLSMFDETIEREGKTIKRFRLVDEKEQNDFNGL